MCECESESERQMTKWRREVGEWKTRCARRGGRMWREGGCGEEGECHGLGLFLFL